MKIFYGLGRARVRSKKHELTSKINCIGAVNLKGIASILSSNSPDKLNEIAIIAQSVVISGKR